MRSSLKLFLACATLGAGVALYATLPPPLDPGYGSLRDPVIDNGAIVFAAAGCASCHAAPKSEGDDKFVLAGGLALPSDFGTFYAPNISPDPEHGIGSWDLPEFARALQGGASPSGQHYYPAFPYTSYRRMNSADVVDLFAYMQTLPASDIASRPHDVGFPFNIRLSLGGWKLLFDRGGDVLGGDLTEQLERGRYLVEALAHCGECHTPRNALGGLQRNAWLSGAPNPSGKGRIPNITPGKLDWSENDLVEYFTSGFTPEYDSAGGEMADVISNLSQLPESDRAAIAAYLKAIPAIE